MSFVLSLEAKNELHLYSKDIPFWTAGFHNLRSSCGCLQSCIIRG